MRWNLILKSAWHDLTKGRGLFIWLLVTLVWGCLIRLARIEQLVFSDPKVLIQRTDMYSFFSAWQEYPFPSVCLLILALTQIYNYQNKVVQREVLAGLTRAEFFLRQYFYTGLLVFSQILFFFFYYFSTDLILRIVHGHFSYDFGTLSFGHIIFEQFVANLFYCSLGLVFINLFRSYMLLLGYIALAVVEMTIYYKVAFDTQLKPYLALLPLKSIELAFSTSFAKLNILAGACAWVCVSILGNAWHWAKSSIK